jgi:hypothetical protein
MIETSLYAYLAAYAGLAALVSDRIYPVIAPQGSTKPCLVYTKIGNDRKHSMQGYSGLQETRIQISCFAELYETVGAVVGAKDVAAQVVAAMEAWEGSAGIQAVFPAGERDMYEPDTELYHIPLDFIIWHSV